MNEQLEQLDKEYVLHTYARNYVNFTKGINATLFDDKNKVCHYTKSFIF